MTLISSLLKEMDFSLGTRERSRGIPSSGFSSSGGVLGSSAVESAFGRLGCAFPQLIWQTFDCKRGTPPFALVLPTAGSSTLLAP